MTCAWGHARRQFLPHSEHRISIFREKWQKCSIFSAIVFKSHCLI